MKEKAYRELNDSDGRPDDVVASEAWDYHLSRNQSIIVDLFHGQVGGTGCKGQASGSFFTLLFCSLQLKSVVTCKVCGYSSVRFDPFTFLSLPLPLDSTFNLEVIGIVHKNSSYAFFIQNLHVTLCLVLLTNISR